MSAALDVLLAAQRAYFAEEASAQAAYAAHAGAELRGGDARLRTRQTTRHPTT